MPQARISGNKSTVTLGVQLRLGLVKSRFWRWKVLKEGTGRCPNCPTQFESIAHILYQCPRYSQSRAVMSRKLGEPLTAENLLRWKRHPRLSFAQRIKLVEDFLGSEGLLARLTE